MYAAMLFVNEFSFSLSNLDALCSLSTATEVYGKRLLRSGRVPFRGKCSVSSLSVVSAVGFLQVSFIRMRSFPSTSSLFTGLAFHYCNWLFCQMFLLPLLR